jgi:phage gp29-like protein
MAQLLDQWGNPIKTRGLREEIVTPSVTGVRQVFDDVVASGLNPARLAQVLRDAAQGEMYDFLTLAEEMEEREFQYRSVLGTRKTAIKGIEAFVKAPTEDAQDIEIADAVKEELVDRPDFTDLVGHLLDSLGKGYAVAEILWETSGTRWDIAGFEERDPRLFQWDRDTRRELRVRTTEDPNGLPLSPFKFVVHTPKLKSGLPARNGLARIAAWAFLLKSFTLKDWAAFLEVHGMPLRLGKYGPGASPQDRAVLLQAVRNLGRDAAAIIPQGMSIDFVEVKGFSEKPFEGFASYIDKQVSKVIIGQTMTADDGSSLGQAAIHDKVRIDIKEDDARDLTVTLNRDVVRPWVDLNFGPRPRGKYPMIVLPVMEREDLAAYASAIGQLVDRGLEIEQAEVRDRIGHREPAKGAKILKPRGASGGGKREPQTPPATDDSSAEEDDDPARADNRYRLKPGICPVCGPSVALNAEILDERDRLVEDALGDWERVMEPIREALQKAFEEATDFDDLDRRLLALAAVFPVDALARHIAILGMKARGNGFTGEIA